MAPIFQIVAAATLATASFASSYDYVEDVKCTLAGKKCAGAPGYPEVPYAPCCDESMVCMSDAKLGWGNFCVEAKEGYEKCYAEGERAIGEEGYDYVPYFPCCAGYPVKDKKRGYGQFCYTPKKYVQKHYVTYPDPITQKKPKYGYKYTGSYDSKYAPKPSMPGYKEEYKTYSTTPKYTAYDAKYGYKYTGSYEPKYVPKPTTPAYKYVPKPTKPAYKYVPKPTTPAYKKEYKTYSKTPKYPAPAYYDKYADAKPEPTTVEYY